MHASPRSFEGEIEAATKQSRRGDCWQTPIRISVGTSGHRRTRSKRAVDSATKGTPAAIASAQTFTRHPRLTMRNPTTAQVRTAIEVLKKLEERIDNHATYNTMQSPETRGSDDIAARIEAQTVEQIARVKTAQLESWPRRIQAKPKKLYCTTCLRQGTHNPQLRREACELDIALLSRKNFCG
jgi:hypothetical protein